MSLFCSRSAMACRLSYCLLPLAAQLRFRQTLMIEIYPQRHKRIAPLFELGIYLTNLVLVHKRFFFRVGLCLQPVISYCEIFAPTSQHSPFTILAYDPLRSACPSAATSPRCPKAPSPLQTVFYLEVVPGLLVKEPNFLYRDPISPPFKLS